MKYKTEISVIIPAYNVEKYIERCLVSLENQDISIPFEIIIVDDGSIDKTGIIIKQFASKTKLNIKYIKKQNGGQSTARNLGIDMSSSKYIAFVDSDDYVENTYLRILYNECEKTHAEISMSGMNRVNDDSGKGARFDSGFSSDFVTNNIEWVLCNSSFAPWNKLYRRELFDNLRFPEGITYEDFALIPQIISRANTIAYVHKSLYHYFVNMDSTIMSREKTKKTDKNIIKAQKILEESEMSINKIVLQNLYIRRVLASMAWSIIEYQEETDIVRNLVIEGKRKYPQIIKDPYIRKLPLAKKMFVFAILRNKIILGKAIVFCYCKLKNLLKSK